VDFRTVTVITNIQGGGVWFGVLGCKIEVAGVGAGPMSAWVAGSQSLQSDRPTLVECTPQLDDWLQSYFASCRPEIEKDCILGL
jgi:hypothetical protein